MEEKMKKLGLFKFNIQLFATDEEENRIDKEQNEDQDYIEAIKTLKENSVPKEKYEELEAKNKKLLGALIDGEQIETEKEGDKPDLNETIKRLHKEMFVDDLFDKLNVGDIPEDVPSKLSGWLLEKCEALPAVGYKFDYFASYTREDEEGEYNDYNKIMTIENLNWFNYMYLFALT